MLVATYTTAPINGLLVFVDDEYSDDCGCVGEVERDIYTLADEGLEPSEKAKQRHAKQTVARALAKERKRQQDKEAAAIQEEARQRALQEEVQFSKWLFENSLKLDHTRHVPLDEIADYFGETDRAMFDLLTAAHVYPATNGGYTRNSIDGLLAFTYYYTDILRWQFRSGRYFKETNG